MAHASLFKRVDLGLCQAAFLSDKIGKLFAIAGPPSHADGKDTEKSAKRPLQHK